MNDAAANQKYIEANGLSIYYEEYGQGEPLVLLHGGTVTGDFNWNVPGITPVLAEHYHVFLPDSRGHGKTNNPAGKLSYAMMADDMAAFIQALGLEKPIIGGWSDGAQIALELGMRYPELTKGLIIGAAWYRFTDQYIELLENWGMTEKVNFEEAEKTPFFTNFIETWKNLHGEDHWREMVQECAKMFWTPLDYTAADFQKVDVPALVLLGDRDQAIPVEVGFEMYQMFPKGELSIVPNGEHNIPWASPQMFSQLVLDFCGRCHVDGDE